MTTVITPLTIGIRKTYLVVKALFTRQNNLGVLPYLAIIALVIIYYIIKALRWVWVQSGWYLLLALAVLLIIVIIGFAVKKTPSNTTSVSPVSSINLSWYFKTAFLAVLIVVGVLFIKNDWCPSLKEFLHIGLPTAQQSNGDFTVTKTITVPMSGLKFEKKANTSYVFICRDGPRQLSLTKDNDENAFETLQVDQNGTADTVVCGKPQKEAGWYKVTISKPAILEVRESKITPNN